MIISVLELYVQTTQLPSFRNPRSFPVTNCNLFLHLERPGYSSHLSISSALVADS